MASFSLKTKSVLFTLTAGALVLSGCAGAPQAKDSGSATADFKPVTIENCGMKITFDKPATQAVTLNQGMTEIVLALGLEKHLVGTAYLDSPIPEKWKKAYDSVKVLAEKYPAKEVFLAAKPDVAFASYSSAFGNKGVGSREELAKQGIKTYVSVFACEDKKLVAEGSFENVWKEVKDIAAIFGKPAAADKLIQEQKDELAKLKQENAGKDKKILWLDSVGEKDGAPFVGAGKGGPQLVMSAVGATNVFSGLDGSWKTTSWEEFIKADPDVIVVIDAEWSPAQSKIDNMIKDPALAKLKAVAEKKFVVIPFANSTAGINLVEGAKQLSQGLQKLK